ncbi:hypothetical protein, partial [Paenibacillus xylanexedens]|uniref:hypothetical protein n=1 Tax=Paenibacillus xylanexedens TaxID=528191 RepID=UPI0039EF5F39
KLKMAVEKRLFGSQCISLILNSNVAISWARTIKSLHLDFSLIIRQDIVSIKPNKSTIFMY